jgi:ElaA protein
MVKEKKLILVKKEFRQLTLEELYAVLRLRAEVFVREQNCPYIDPDNEDQEAFHVLGYALTGTELLAYARLLKPGAYGTEPSIGRVVTAKQHRRQKLGKVIFAEALAWCRQLFPNQTIRIMAQEYLKRFYEEFDFQVVSEPFLEDDIWHVDMVLLPHIGVNTP